MTYTIRHPATAQEFREYYHLRWRLLRAPWGEPEGSEKDDIEDDCTHVIAVDNNRVVGVGRCQYNSEHEAQTRYMAVEPAYEGRGIGRGIVEALEQQALNDGRSHMVLDAREPAVGFYEKLGYQVVTSSYLLFGCIQHYRMDKKLQ